MPASFFWPFQSLMATAFTTPILTSLLRCVAGLGLKLSGWKLDLSEMPQPPFVFIGAPHTSNWDFLLMLGAVFYLKLDCRWLGKDSLFKPPFGSLMRWLGGIPVDRSRANNAVQQTALLFQRHQDLVICIPPEGTRKKVAKWKTGFYFIALEAKVPIAMTVIDAENRCIRFLGTYSPSGDAEREIREIQRHYGGYRGLIPENACELLE